jgi:hypothetical protein
MLIKAKSGPANVIDKKELITELTNLRASIADLHNHKETTAYAAFTLNLGAAAWVAGSSPKGAIVSILVLIGSIALHMAMRFQLIQRRHCAQFYQVYTSAIRDLIQIDSDKIDMPLVTKSQWPNSGPNKFLKYFRLVMWTRTESLYTADLNYPVYSVVHDHIVRTSKNDVSKKNSLIEILPTLGGIVCLLVIAANAGNFIIPSMLNWTETFVCGSPSPG